MVESSDVISIKCAKCHRRRHPFILRAHNILCRVEGNCRPPSETPTHRLQYDVNFYTVFPRILSYPLSTSPIHSGGRKDGWWRWTRRKPRCFRSWTKALNHTAVTQIRPSNPESAWVYGCVSWAVSIVIILFYSYFRTKVLDVLIQLNLVVGDLLHWRSCRLLFGSLVDISGKRPAVSQSGREDLYSIITLRQAPAAWIGGNGMGSMAWLATMATRRGHNAMPRKAFSRTLYIGGKTESNLV